MDSYTMEELDEALRAISSLVSKSKKAQEKLWQGTSQKGGKVYGFYYN